MRNPFRREKALSASSDVVNAIQSGWRPIQLLGSGSRDRIQGIYNVAQSASYSWRYENSPAVRTVIDVIARNVGQLELRLYEEVDAAERQPKPDHPAALSLRYPNENSSSDSFLRAMFKDKLIHDNAYAVITQGPDRKVSLMHIPAYMVQVQGSSLFQVDNYRIWNQGAWGSGMTWSGHGTAVDVVPENVIHWHGENPLDPRVGLSMLDTLAAVIAEDAALQAAITELANSGMTEPVWAFRPENAPELTTRTRMLMEEDMGNRLRGRNRRPIVLEEGTEFRSFSVSPRDAEMMEVRKWALSRVAAAYGVPSEMVGVPSARGDTAVMAQGGFYADCLMPICKDFTRFMNYRLLVGVYDWPEGAFEFNLDEKLMGDQRLTALVSASGGPVLTRNESRAMVNRPPVKNGDELITPLNVQVGDNPKPSPQVMGPQDPNKPPQDGSYRQDQGATPVPSGNQGAKAMNDKVPQFHPRRSADMRRQEQAIPQFEKLVKRHLNRIGREYGEKAIQEGAYKGAADWAKWATNFTTDLLRLLKKATRAEASIYTFKLAGSQQFDMGQVEHYLEAKASGAVSGLTEKFREEIAELGLELAMERVDEHAAGAGSHLGVSTMTFARESAARQAPGFPGRIKTWVADTARHAQYDGQTVPLDKDWPQGFAPGTERNCRCCTTIS